MVEILASGSDTGCHQLSEADLLKSTADAWAHALRLFVECEALKARVVELERRLAVFGG